MAKQDFSRFKWSPGGYRAVQNSGTVQRILSQEADSRAGAANARTVAHGHESIEHFRDGHWHECAACGNSLDYAGHMRTVENEKKATCTDEGYTGDTVCSVCGYVIAKGETIPATGHSYQDGICTVCGAEEPAKNEETIPATGDVAPLVCALAGISGIALVVAGLCKRTSQ